MDADMQPSANADEEVWPSLDLSGGPSRPLAELFDNEVAIESLRRSSELLRAIFLSSPVPIVTIDPQGIVTGWNPAAERTFGWKPEEAIGRLYPLMPKGTEHELFDRIRSVMEGRPLSQKESRRVRKDGTIIDVTISTAPLSDASGDVAGIVVLIEDISERKKAEAELTASELLFRSLFENAAVGMVTVDLDLRPTRVNAAFERFIGYSNEELRSLRTDDYTYPEDLKRHLEFHAEQLGSVRSWYQMEKRYVRKNGEIVWGQLSASVARDGEGNPRFGVGIVEDISERKRAEEKLLALKDHLEQRVAARTAELQEANREMEEFSYSVSHDLRAPLRSIDGFAMALQEDCGDRLDEEGREYLSRVRAASQRMGQLINGLLSLSKVSRSEFTRERVDLSGMARSIAEELRRAEPVREVEFVIQPWLVATGDEQQLRLVLENLLGNAWKFTRKHPRARIEFGSTDVEGGRAFFVRDDGAGFDMAQSSRLFGVFQRLHGHTEFEGTGIGLASVQRIIQRHGGRAWAEGKPEEGAIFYFTL